MELKKINPKDNGELLFKMDVQAFCRDFDYPSPSVEKTLDYLKDCDVHLAYENNELVGLVAYKNDHNAIELKQLVILPQFQGKGYGKELVKKLLELTKGHKVWLVTHPKNSAAIVLYVKNGFKITSWKDNYYGDEPRLVLER